VYMSFHWLMAPATVRFADPDMTTFLALPVLEKR
jgi:hypothetical protein